MMMKALDFLQFIGCVLALAFFSSSSGLDSAEIEENRSLDIELLDNEVQLVEKKELKNGLLTMEHIIQRERTDTTGDKSPLMNLMEEMVFEKRSKEKSCLQYDGWAIEYFYKIAGCKIEVDMDNKCTIVYDCPKGCIPESNDGKLYKIGEKWKKDKDVCECVWPRFLYFDVPGVPSGGVPLPPVKMCRLEGCETEDEKFLEPKRNYMNHQGHVCRCVKGPDPYLMDFPTLFHIQCYVDAGGTPDVPPPGGVLEDSIPAEITDNMEDNALNDFKPKKKRRGCMRNQPICTTGKKCCGCPRMFIDPSTGETSFPRDVVKKGLCRKVRCLNKKCRGLWTKKKKNGN
ncbi:unnamed protein product [Owenia fusiformis]|uniref:Uncharacterized protein n=1 Tax=Owenia fusiformis TaxID=6347 RepID=A0A8S4PV91_OWEFU|nr:unnamed protein product [Owenia fusiformis]